MKNLYYLIIAWSLLLSGTALTYEKNTQSNILPPTVLQGNLPTLKSGGGGIIEILQNALKTKIEFIKEAISYAPEILNYKHLFNEHTVVIFTILMWNMQYQNYKWESLEENVTKEFEATDYLHWFTAPLVIGLLSSTFEEVFFRQNLYGRFLGYFKNEYLASITSATLFAIAHCVEVDLGIDRCKSFSGLPFSQFTAGLLFNSMTRTTGDLGLSVFNHFWWNFIFIFADSGFNGDPRRYWDLIFPW